MLGLDLSGSALAEKKIECSYAFVIFKRENRRYSSSCVFSAHFHNLTISLFTFLPSSELTNIWQQIIYSAPLCALRTQNIKSWYSSGSFSNGRLIKVVFFKFCSFFTHFPILISYSAKI